jgi:hypothetical protein
VISEVMVVMALNEVKRGALSGNEVNLLDVLASVRQRIMELMS